MMFYWPSSQTFIHNIENTRHVNYVGSCGMLWPTKSSVSMGLLIDPKVLRGNSCGFKNPRGEKFSPGLIVPPWAEGESWWQPTTSFSSFKFRWTFPSHKRNCKQNCFPILHNTFIPSPKRPHKMITDDTTQRSYIRLCLRDSLLFANQAQTLVGNPNKEQRSPRWGVLLPSQCKSKG